MLPYNKRNTPNSRALRKNMTPEERQLWYHFFKKLPFTVRRQLCIDEYVVDFYIAEKKIVIEVDGIQHGRMIDRQKDMIRDSRLAELGIKVLRIKNVDVNYNFEGVVSYILRHLGVKYEELK